MSKEFKVMLDITLTETHFVDADNEEEAFEQAKRDSNAVAECGDAHLFQIEEVR